MRKRFSAAMALALSCAMVLTACSGGSKPAETTAAAAADTTAAAAETTAAAAAAPSGDAQKLTMGTGGTTGPHRVLRAKADSHHIIFADSVSSECSADTTAEIDLLAAVLPRVSMYPVSGT